MTVLPYGKGLFVWTISSVMGHFDGDYGQLGTYLKNYLALDFVIVKVLDSYIPWNRKNNELSLFLDACIDQDLPVWGYQYLYGANSLGQSLYPWEATAAVEQMRTLPLQGLYLDVEGEFKRKGARDWARGYFNQVTISLADTIPYPMGMCSFRYPSYHREVPWDIFLENTDFHAPQVYWMESYNPAYQLLKSYNELKALKDMPFFPVGSAFREWGWEPTVSNLNEFNTQAWNLNLSGVSWWCLDDRGLLTHPQFAETIALHDWSARIPGPQPPGPIATNLENWAVEVDAFLRLHTGYNGPKPRTS